MKRGEYKRFNSGVFVSRDRVVLAYHESAHACISVVNGQQFNFVTVIHDKRTRTKGRVDYDGYETVEPPEVRVLSTLAARHAQRRYAPRSDWHRDSRSDWDGADNYLVLYSSDWVPRAYTHLIHRRSKLLVAKYWNEIRKVAIVLVARKTMTEAEVRATMGWPLRVLPASAFEPDTEWFEREIPTYDDSCLVEESRPTSSGGRPNSGLTSAKDGLQTARYSKGKSIKFKSKIRIAKV